VVKGRFVLADRTNLLIGEEPFGVIPIRFYDQRLTAWAVSWNEDGEHIFSPNVLEKIERVGGLLRTELVKTYITEVRVTFSLSSRNSLQRKNMPKRQEAIPQ
jgi:hypothetical protein